MCWAYVDKSEFRARAGEFLSEGLRLGQEVRYVGSGDPSQLMNDLVGFDAVTAGFGEGAVQVVSLADAYPADAIVDPIKQVSAYASATEGALRAGFTGLRVAAECTSLVHGPQQLAAFARYEHQIDRYMAGNPFSAMCGYDSAQLGCAVVAQLASMHPSTNVTTIDFRLHGSDLDGFAAALGGELDWSTRELFTLALQRADLRAIDGKLAIDATEMSYIDHNALLQLAALARRHEAILVLRTRWPGAARLVHALGLDEVRVEHAE